MTRRFVALALIVLAALVAAAPVLGGDKDPCARYSDEFDKLDSNRWYATLFYSENPGRAECQNGRLVLASPSDEPGEVQVYSLFTFEGDFDVALDYTLLQGEDKKGCRFNAGLVLETDPGDELSYKAYVGLTPEGKRVFKARLDRLGIEVQEKKKAREVPAPVKGTLRMKRKDGVLSFWAGEGEALSEIYAFEKTCDKKLRVRLKLTTGSKALMQDACPTAVGFDRFTVNACTGINPG